MLPRCLWAITDVSLTFHTFLSGWHLYCHSITCDHYRVKAFHWWWWMFRVISQAVELLKGCFIQHATEHNVFSHLGCGRIPKTDFGYVFCLLGYLIVMLCLVTITIGHSSQFTVHSSEMMSKTPYKHWNTIHNTKVSLSDELVCIRFLKSRTLLDCDVFMHHNTTIQTAIKSSEMVVIRFTVPVIIRPRLLHFSARFQTKLPETKTETRLFWLGWRDVPARHGTLLCLR